MSMTTPLSGDDPWGTKLASMTVAEKEQLLNRILVDLAQQPDDFVAPEWHREILESRRKAIDDGSEVFEDLEDVKRELLEEC